MEIVSSISEMVQWSEEQRRRGRTIGFVPTMGALHDGHVSLLSESARDNDATVLSIFVNPTQFNESSDFDSYPRTWTADAALAEHNNVSLIFSPTAAEMYPSDGPTAVVPATLAHTMEGRHRPGHFSGVATIVLKLLNIVGPNCLYLGLKDFQQVAVLRAMVADLNVRVRVVEVPTVRDADGLALSSRNERLTEKDRFAARVLYRALRRAKELHLAGEHEASRLRDAALAVLAAEPRCELEYLEIVDSDTLQELSRVATDATVCVAARFGQVRLIDNIQLST